MDVDGLLYCPFQTICLKIGVFESVPFHLDAAVQLSLVPLIHLEQFNHIKTGA